MISPSNRSAIASARALLPVAVGPNTATALALFNGAHCHPADRKATAEHAEHAEIFFFFSAVTLHSSSLARCGWKATAERAESAEICLSRTVTLDSRSHCHAAIGFEERSMCGRRRRCVSTQWRPRWCPTFWRDD